MSRRPKNNHYHYAEKFQRRNRRLSLSDVLKAPRKALTLAFIALLAFGFISTTFAAYVSSDSFVENASGSIIVRSRNTLAAREGTIKDPAFSRNSNKEDSDIAMSGADMDLAPTAAQTYYYTGEGNDDAWANHVAMSVSDDGFYEYYKIDSYFTHQFKIGISSDYYKYNYSYVDKEFNGTDVENIGDYGSNNCYCWHGSAHYIIVYYPNTLINTTANPKICASTTLPDNKPRVYLGEKFTSSSTDTYHAMTDSSGTWSCSVNLTGNQTKKFFFKVVYGTEAPDSAPAAHSKYYKDQNGSTMYYNNCTNWQFETNNGSDPQLATVITGSYQFRFVFSSKKVSVVYPSYTVTTSWIDNDGDASINPAASAPTPATSTVAIGSGVQVNAATPSTGYEFLGWDVKVGTVKTGSYSGTNLTARTTANPLTVYPYGTSGSVELQAVYRIKEYSVTYNKNSGITEGGSISPNPQVKQHNIAYTITSSTYTRNGYTQQGWSTTDGDTNVEYAAGASYSGNADLSLYPVWSIDAPTVSVSDPLSSFVAESTTPLSLTHTASSASGISVVKTFAITSSPPSAVVGTNCSVNNAGEFLADIPGEYIVTLTGEVTDNNTTNVTATASDTCTIVVVPDKPSFQITLTGRSSEGDASEGNPWKILQGATYQFSAAVDNPKAGYAYIWYWSSDGGTTWSSDFTSAPAPYLTPSYTSTTGTNDGVTFASVQANAPTEAAEFKLRLETQINNQSAQADDVGKWYFVQPLIDRFTFDPAQKIYSALYAASISASYNLTNPSGYTTNLYFSSDNNSFIPIQRKSDSFISSFESTLRNFFYPEGVKYFKMEIADSNVTSTSQTLHTTVGTSNSDVVRPYYFINNVSGLDLTNYRVMAYWIDPSSNSGYSYQTAQDVYKGVSGKPQSSVFRINLPADATEVIFAVADKRYYGTPTYSNGTFTFSTPFFTACTQVQTLEDYNLYTVTTSDGAALPTLSGAQSYFIAQ